MLYVRGGDLEFKLKRSLGYWSIYRSLVLDFETKIMKEGVGKNESAQCSQTKMQREECHSGASAPLSEP